MASAEAMPMARSSAAAAVTAAPAAVAALKAKDAVVVQTPAATSARSPSSAASKLNYRHFVGGAVGGMTAAIITSPLEVVKTRLQIKGAR